MPFPWAVPGGRRLRALCGPQGTAGPPRRQNAPRRPAAMAGEAHPVPSRTRKLSPRAPIVLRVQPVGDQDAAGRLGAFSPGGAQRRARCPSFFVQAYLLICLGRTPSVGFGPFFVIRPLVACVRCLMGPQINCRRSEYLSSCLRDRRIFYLVSIPARPPPGCLLRHGARGRLSPVV